VTESRVKGIRDVSDCNLDELTDKETCRGLIGRNGLPDVNPSAVPLLDFCASHGLSMMNV